MAIEKNFLGEDEQAAGLLLRLAGGSSDPGNAMINS
jgi:hypothetical protein